MKICRWWIMLGLFSWLARASAEERRLDAKPQKEMEKVSYAIGQNIASSMKAQGIEIDLDFLLAGMRDTFENRPSRLSEEEATAVLQAYQAKMEAKHRERMATVATENQAAGKAFLEKNAQEKNVVTLPSGLQYKILRAGEGPLPKLTDRVTVHYRGTLLDGTEFDSSYRRGEPATFPVQGVIRGWIEALQRMPVGSKWLVWIPSDLAYGERGAPPAIGPNATLIFEIELLSIEAP